MTSAPPVPAAPPPVPPAPGLAPVAVLPFGAVEQHGPDLPVDTDSLLAEAIAARAVRLAQDHGVAARLLPTLAYGASAEHLGWPGTLSLQAETALVLLRDIGRSLALAQPESRLLVVNGHGGNRGVIDLALRDLRRNGSPPLVGAGFSLGDAPLAPSLSPPLSPLDRLHGGRMEAALLMALGLLDKAPRPQAMRPELAKLANLGPGKPGKLAWLAEDLSDSGSVHGSVPATRDDGKVLLDQLTRQAAAVIGDLAAYRPPPPVRSVT